MIKPDDISEQTDGLNYKISDTDSMSIHVRNKYHVYE